MEHDFNNLFTQEELDIDFTTVVNMFSGMDYDTAHKEAVKDYKEYKAYQKKLSIINENSFCSAATSPDQSPEILQAICLNHNQGQDNCPEYKGE